MNIYGMRWLMPFVNKWFYADALFIIDLWMMLALLAAVLLGSVVDALGGHVPAIVTPLAEVLPHAREGKLRILATTARERTPLAPDIPTFHELGFDKIVVQDWSGFLAPAARRSSRDRSRMNLIIAMSSG